MKTCNRCNQALSQGIQYCPSCGADQRNDGTQAYSDTFLKVLCTLTIIGCALGLLTIPVLFARDMAMYSDEAVYIRVGTSALATIGKLTGAILMLQKRISGLYFYTVSGIVGICITVWSALEFTSVGDGIGNEAGVAIGLLSTLPAIAFIVMYWLPVNRRLLS